MFSDPQVTLAYSASDSQITLTNPLPALELYSSKRSVTNTVLSHNGKPYISISTVDRAVSCTEIKDLRTDQLLVTIQRRTIVPDTITFEQRFDDQQLKIKNWLVELKTGDTRSAETYCHVECSSLKKISTISRIREWLVKKPIGNFIWRSTVDIRLAVSYYCFHVSLVSHEVISALCRVRPRTAHCVG